MTINYLLSKVRKPRIQPEMVRRPHLVEEIEKGSWRKLTLVCAPPGFGKTTLLTEWSRMTQFPVCWLQEDEQDNLLDNFLAYLCLSIQQAFPEFGPELMQMVKLSPRPGIDHFATTFIHELEKLPKKICLVLDDHHLITNIEIHHFLRIVLDYLPQNIHLILSSREDPPLPLGRYRAKNELTEIRTVDLRFTQTETNQFIDSITHTDLSPTSLEALHDRTEGWAAGIQLAGLSIMESGNPDQFIRDFTGSNRFILDYLVEDVLNRQPEEIREFLLKTSILKKLNVPLCNAITANDNSEKLLARVKAANLFLIPLDENQEWYRYHNLFADLLQYRLKHEVPENTIKELHASAAKWLEANQLLADAVQHYFLAGELQSCENAATTFASKLLEDGEAAHVLDWIDSLPGKIFDTSLGLIMIYCYALVTASKGGSLILYYPKIELMLAGIKEYLPHDQYLEMVARLDVIKAMYFSTRGELDQAIDLFDGALLHIRQDDTLLVGAIIGKAVAIQAKGEVETAEQLFSMATSKAKEMSMTMLEISSMCTRSGMLLALGKLHQAEELLITAINISLSTGGKRNPIVASAYLGLAGIYLVWNRLEEARSNLLESYEWLARWGNMDSLMNFLFTGTRLSFNKDFDYSKEYIKKARELESMGQLNPVTVLLAKNIYLYGAIYDGDNHSARHLVSDIWGMPENYSDLTFTDLVMTGIEASLHFSIFEPEELLPRLQKILDITGKNSRKMEQNRAFILLTIIYNRIGRKDQAEKILFEAVSSACEEHNIANFLYYGNQIRDNLLTMKSRISDHSQLDFVEDILTHIPQWQVHPSGMAAGKTNQNMGDGTLSERESEVISLLASGLSTSAIAERLVLSQGTIKRHLHNIFEKLGVQSRTQAIQEARKLGILDNK